MFEPLPPVPVKSHRGLVIAGVIFLVFVIWLLLTQILAAQFLPIGWAQSIPQVPERYPGQSQHKEPPPGWVCEKDAKDPAHDCQCKRHFIPDPENKDCCHEIMEDRDCSSWCWPKHCHCPVGECKVPR